MNAATRTVVAILYSAASGEVSQIEMVYDHPNMQSCLTAAANVIEMDHVLGVDCRWIKVTKKVWRVSFGDKI